MGYKIAIVTQTPLIKFNRNYSTVRRSIKIENIDPSDYQFTVGGVSNMERALVRRFFEDRFASKIFWFTLNPNAPETILWDKNFKVINLKTNPKFLNNYTEFKEILWNNIHGIESKSFSVESYLGYLMHNWIFTRNILERAGNFDVYYIHDFQQLLMGSMIGPMKPAILRWHVPFIPENFNDKIRKFIVSGLEGFDGIIVSTKRDLEGLIRTGFRGVAFQVYPHINPDEWKKPSKSDLNEFNDRYGIGDDDFLVLNVARMDSMKSQDVLIRAFARFRKKVRNAKLMLVGNGSFTSSATGLKSDKGKTWRIHLENIVNDLNLEGSVIFTGYLQNDILYSAYERADLFVLPSMIEGFGLTVVESWLYGKCTIVSDGAGVSELINNEINGLKFKSGDLNDLYGKMMLAYSKHEMRENCGRNAIDTARSCYVSSTEPKIRSIIENVMNNFSKT